jgi:hypothetical protein
MGSMQSITLIAEEDMKITLADVRTINGKVYTLDCASGVLDHMVIRFNFGMKILEFLANRLVGSIGLTLYVLAGNDKLEFRILRACMVKKRVGYGMADLTYDWIMDQASGELFATNELIYCKDTEFISSVIQGGEPSRNVMRKYDDGGKVDQKWIFIEMEILDPYGGEISIVGCGMDDRFRPKLTINSRSITGRYIAIPGVKGPVEVF